MTHSTDSVTHRHDGQHPGELAPDDRRSLSRRRLAIVVCGVLALTTITALAAWPPLLTTERAETVEDDRPGDDRAVDYRAAVALEHGVRPLVSDRVGELGTVTAVTVERTPDPDPARVHLLAPAGEERARLSIVSDPAVADLTVDGLLADGRPYQTYVDEGRYVSLATVGTDGQHVEAMGRDMSFADLVELVGAVTVGHAGVAHLPPGWVEIGAVPMPPWHHGFATHYDFLGGRRLGITVEPHRPGREQLAAFALTEPIDLGLGEWAYRFLPPSSGIVFRTGDDVVKLTGDFSEAEFVIVAHTLRLMRPGEHAVGEPDPYPF